MSGTYYVSFAGGQYRPIARVKIAEALLRRAVLLALSPESHVRQWMATLEQDGFIEVTGLHYSYVPTSTNKCATPRGEAPRRTSLNPFRGVRRSTTSPPTEAAE